MKKRVLMVSCGGLGKGGVQAIMMGIIRNLHTEYYFDMLLFTSEKRYYDDEFLSYGGKVFRIPHYEGNHNFLRLLDSVTRDLRIYREFVKILRNEQSYDIIHCNKEYESAPIIKVAAKFNIPIIICHTHIIHKKTNYFKHLVNRIRIKIIEKHATHLIGCSENACSTIYSTKYQIYNNFYDNNLFKFTNTSVLQDLTLTQVGYISQNKNQLFSIKVVKCLRNKGFDARLKLIGFVMDKEYKNQLDSFISHYSMGDVVIFKSGNCDIPSELVTSSCVIVPSFSEGFSIVTIEAQAVGLCCFASKAIPKTTNCGNVVYLDLNDGAEIWADMIIKWYQTYEGGKSLCDTSAFSIANVMKNYRKLYRGN